MITADGSKFKFDQKYFYYNEEDEIISWVTYPKSSSHIDGNFVRMMYQCHSFTSLHITEKGAMGDQLRGI